MENLLNVFLTINGIILILLLIFHPSLKGVYWKYTQEKRKKNEDMKTYIIKECVEKYGLSKEDKIFLRKELNDIIIGPNDKIKIKQLEQTDINNEPISLVTLVSNNTTKQVTYLYNRKNISTIFPIKNNK